IQRGVEVKLPRWSAAAIMLVAAMAPPVGRADVISESKNFRLIDSITIGGVAVSGQVVGDTYFVSSWQTGLYSYDVSDPKEPKQLDHMGADEIQIQSNENEDMATNGEILLLSQFNRTDALNRLLVIDVRNPKDMNVIATLPGAGGHTLTCLYDCKWAYGSGSGSSSAGIIVDLRNPREPKLLDERWSDAMGGKSAHDVTEVKPGLVVTSSTPMFVLDVSDPTKPRVLARTDPSAPHTGHNNIWPRAGKDRFLISASEGVNNGRCEMYDEDGKTLQVWDMTDWRTGNLKPIGSYTLTNGTGSDGHPPLDLLGVQGCSAHWAQEHPSFNNGGLVAMAAYSQGVRLLDVGEDGKPREVGYFLKDIHGAIDVEWITDRIVYVIEDGGGVGGFDVIEYTGKL
ncbi:MAG: LVIVD repeat-containing protein, partial [Actinomycetota bacterium]